MLTWQSAKEFYRKHCLSPWIQKLKPRSFKKDLREKILGPKLLGELFQIFLLKIINFKIILLESHWLLVCVTPLKSSKHVLRQHWRFSQAETSFSSGSTYKYISVLPFSMKFMLVNLHMMSIANVITTDLLKSNVSLKPVLTVKHMLSTYHSWLAHINRLYILEMD